MCDQCVSYWALSDVLSPLVHVGALLDGGAALLFVIPATVRVPRFHAMTNVSADNQSAVVAVAELSSLSATVLFAMKY